MRPTTDNTVELIATRFLSRIVILLRPEGRKRERYIHWEYATGGF